MLTDTQEGFLKGLAAELGLGYQDARFAVGLYSYMRSRAGKHGEAPADVLARHFGEDWFQRFDNAIRRAAAGMFAGPEIHGRDEVSVGDSRRDHVESDESL